MMKRMSSLLRSWRCRTCYKKSANTILTKRINKKTNIKKESKKKKNSNKQHKN